MKQADFGFECSFQIDGSSRSQIQQAYDHTVSYGARLAAFSACEPLRTFGPFHERQEQLAIDDLTSFGLHSRRLAELTQTRRLFRARGVLVKGKHGATEKDPFDILNMVIHHKDLRIIRNLMVLKLLIGKAPSWQGLNFEDWYSYISPVVYVKSDRNKEAAFILLPFLELFQKRVILRIVSICEENGIHLDLEEY
ncbi:hypothetical protein [Pelagibius sp.]|uniref:hypothetical protein n=1 Tax=Pelagibius sp. TaxID=1931238 RepID=UPI00260DFF8B|nr:hypothetical protein [Pelagibius sp.]